MLPSAILGLINNAALLLALGVLYDLPGFSRPRGRRSLQEAATGLALGGICVAVMLNPWRFAPGVVFDTRSVVLALSGLFFGLFPTAVAALVAAAFRLAVGGAGALTGVIVIVVSGAIGVLWPRVRRRAAHEMHRRELYLFGVVVHVAMLLCMFTLPWPLPLQVLPVIALPVMLIYPLATALMGWLLANRERRRRAEANRHAALDALRVSEARFHELFARMGSGVAVYEPLPDGSDFIIRDLNDAALRITGVKREDAIGRPVTEVFPGIRDFGLLDVFRRVWETGAPERHAAGRYVDDRLAFWAENQVYKLPSGEIVAVFDDITERRQAEAALRESEAQLRAVFHSSADLITIADIETGVYLDVNDGFLQATGYARDEIIGKTGDDLRLWCDPDRRREVVRRLAEGEAVRNEEVWFRKKDGTEFVGLLTAEIIHLAGRACLLCVVRDITERKRAEQALLNGEQRYQTLAESSPVGIFRADADGHTTYVNPAWSQISGMGAQDALANGWLQQVHPDDRDRIKAGWQEAVDKGARSETEYRFVRPNGSVAWVMGRAVPETDSEGRVVGWVGTIVDITEHRQMEEALRRRNEELDILNRLGLALAQTLDLSRVAEIARDHVSRLVDAPVFGISLYDAEARTLSAGFMWSDGVALDVSQFPPLTIPQELGEDVRGRARAILTGEPEVVESLAEAAARATDGVHHIGPPGDTRDAQCAVYVPMVVEGRVVGLLEAQSYRPRAYSERDVSLLRTVANQIGLAIQNARLFRQVQERAADLERSLAEVRRAEQALRESEARFRGLVESMDDVIFTLDTEGRHTGVFGQWLERYGTPPEVYLGKTTREVLGPEAAPVHEEANARALAGQHVVYEWSAPGADGMLYFQTSLSPLRGPDGQVVGIVGVGRDITALKRAEQALRESEQRYRSLVNLSPDGILVHRYGEVLFANAAAAALFGAEDPQALVGRQTLDFIAPEFREMVWERIRRGQEEREPQPLIEEKLLRLDGTEFYADVCAVPIEWEGAPAVQVIIRDSTERKQMEERLLQAQKMEVVGRLAGGIAHDFNNILTAMTGYATFALEALPPGDPVRADVEQVIQSAQRAANLTRQLLLFSRRQIIEQRVINLNDLILDLDKMLRRLIGEDVELVAILGEGLARVKADPGQIEQVIVNLAVNARDAMPDGGKLILETANAALDAEYARRHPGMEPGDYVMLAVTDTGVGMTDEVKAHLFEPFFTTKEPGKGTGLGLASVYGIVKQHGGNIYCESEPGKGTTFRIYLPAVEAEAERLPRRDEEGIVPRGTETVLVVEDEAMVRDILTRTLREQGYRVLEAMDGEQALRVANEYAGEIHLLVTDVVMPQMNGQELSERLAAVRPGIKTLFVSGYTDNAIVRKGILKPGIVFLQKPFTAAALARKVRQGLDMGDMGL